MLTNKIKEQLKGEVLNISIWVNGDNTLSATFMTKGLPPAIATGITEKELDEEIELYLAGKEVPVKAVEKSKPSDKKAKGKAVAATKPMIVDDEEEDADLGTEEENAIDEVLPPVPESPKKESAPKVETPKAEPKKEAVKAPVITNEDDDFDF